LQEALAEPFTWTVVVTSPGNFDPEVDDVVVSGGTSRRQGRLSKRRVLAPPVDPGIFKGLHCSQIDQASFPIFLSLMTFG
jgi:hypothetical protein